jgi:hypothetical protein
MPNYSIVSIKMFLTFLYLGRIPPEEALIDPKDFKAMYDFYLVAYKF